MKKSLTTGAAAFALILALAGCSSGTPGSDASAPPASQNSDDMYSSEDQSAAPEAAGALLMTADSSLGEIVVDGEGMTVYMFDNDTQGATSSACSGECASNWPAVTTDSAELEVEGVTGEVGTITGVDGETQLTLNGWPLYYFAGDSAAGDVNGQGVNDVWWVLTAAGERMAG
jgi:predicted lipoprotein with Yx(FWY)xxD motif